MTKQKWVWLVYSFTIVLGAFLMFLVQPLIGKIVTPQYGGVAQVWCLCLLFFQLALLGGYALTFALSKLSPRLQGFAYVFLMVCSIFFVKIPLGEGWTPDPEAPVESLLLQLSFFLALPCILISTVSTMMQHWFQLSRQGEPYHLYSVSNIGSMGALLAYPILIEPNISVESTLQLWTWGYWALVAFAVITAGLTFLKYGKLKETEKEETEKDETNKRISLPFLNFSNYFWWIGLSAVGSVLLVSYSNHLTHDVAPIPLLWVLPLFIYLLTFVLCFSKKAFYQRAFFVFTSQFLFLGLAIGSLVVLAFYLDSYMAIYMSVNLVSTLLTLFLYGMLCHGELYLRRPEPSQLPAFYLSIAFGGALGGGFVNLLSPILFNGFHEFYLINFLMLCFTAFLVIKFKLSLLRQLKWTNLYLCAFICVVSFSFVIPFFFKGSQETVYENRNFYGALKVTKAMDSLSLVHGTTVHGKQMIDEESGLLMPDPTLYYSRGGTVGVVNHYLRAQRSEQGKHKPLKIGAIGLGVGSIAAYGEAGDALTFYEIDPNVTEVAKKYFTFLGESQAKIDIILGDGRLKLKEHQAFQDYDLLVIDAFNGDAVPVHLLTKEAFELYSKHVKPNGLILIHMSNKFLDLHPIVNNIGINLGLHPITMNAVPDDGFGVSSTYSVLSKSDWFFEKVNAEDFKTRFPNIAFRPTQATYPHIRIWTDSFSNIFSALLFMKSKADNDATLETSS